MRAWILPVALFGQTAAAEPVKQPGHLALDVRSTAFGPNEGIPSEYTCQGSDHAPSLSWSKPPRETKSIAILVEDPDALGGTFAHWIVTELPPVTTLLRANAALPHGAVAGKNDTGETGWKGPCPPSGTHHYVFHVYDLDKRLGPTPMTRADLLAAIDGHVVAEGKLVGLYGKAEP